MAEIPAEHHVIHAVAILRITLLDDFQPDQHPPDIQRREANFAGLVGVVHLLGADGVIGFVRQLVAEQHQGIQRGEKFQHPAIEFCFINNPQLARRRQGSQIGGAVPHGGGGIFVYRIYQARRRLIVGDEILPCVLRDGHLSGRQLAAARRVTRCRQLDIRTRGRKRQPADRYSREQVEKDRGSWLHGVAPAGVDE